MWLVRSGGDLLSHVLRRSTIGAAALNFRVREGIGCFARAVTTRPEKRHASAGAFSGPRFLGARPDYPEVCLTRGPGPGFFPERVWVGVLPDRARFLLCLAVSGSNQANRAISTGQLNALLRLHLRPIDVMVYHGSQGRPCFEGGFPLRCFQRLSLPDVATLRWP